MNREVGIAEVRTWFRDVLLREGAVIEDEAGGALFACLPGGLQQRVGLPEAASLRVLDEAGDGEIAVALEGGVLQACLDLAASRGALAAARLPASAMPPERALALAGPALQIDNSAVRAGDVQLGTQRWLVLELAWTAAADERESGSVFVAHAAGIGVGSTAVAAAVLANLGSAASSDRLPGNDEIAAAAAGVWPLGRPEIDRAVGPFVRSAGARLRREQTRLSAYYERLLAEARRRRGRAAADGGGGGVEAKLAAIARDREEKGRELAERFAVRCEVQVASVLAAEFEAPVVEFLVRRKGRERIVGVAVDPWGREAVARCCEACGLPARVFHACDEAVHLVCMRCKEARCVVCRGGAGR